MIESDLTEISPFTGKKSVIVETTAAGIETRICMDTGFTTNSEYKIGSDKIEEVEKSTTQLIRELRYTDDSLGQYWYPTTAMFSTGMIYPEGTTEKWNWVYAPIIEVPEEEQEKYPIPGKPGEYYTTRLATDVAEYYVPTDFQEVCKRVGMAKNV
jgi:hypothetical protein